MPQLAEPTTHICIFPSNAHGDLTIEWDEASQDAITPQIQALMDKGVTFFRLEENGKNRKSTVAVPVNGTDEIKERKLLIKDPDIAKIVEGGLATIARFQGVGEIKTSGKVKTAAEAASTDTVAVQPAKGG